MCRAAEHAVIRRLIDCKPLKSDTWFSYDPVSPLFLLVFNFCFCSPASWETVAASWAWLASLQSKGGKFRGDFVKLWILNFHTGNFTLQKVMSTSCSCSFPPALQPSVASLLHTADLSILTSVHITASVSCVFLNVWNCSCLVEEHLQNAD